MSPADRKRAGRVLKLAMRVAEQRILAISEARRAEHMSYGSDRIDAVLAHKHRLKVVRAAARELLYAADIQLHDSMTMEAGR